MKHPDHQLRGAEGVVSQGGVWKPEGCLNMGCALPSLQAAAPPHFRSLTITVGRWAGGGSSVLTCRVTWMLLGPKVVVP